MLKTVLASLAPEDALLVKHLLQDKSVGSVVGTGGATVHLSGEDHRRVVVWRGQQARGHLDLTDEVVVAQAKAYLFMKIIPKPIKLVERPRS